MLTCLEFGEALFEVLKMTMRIFWSLDWIDSQRLNGSIKGMKQGMVLQSEVRIRHWAVKLEVAAGDFLKRIFLLNFWFEFVSQMIKK